MSEFTPTFWIAETGDQIRLGLNELGCAEGATLQDAADALVSKMLIAAMALRSSGIGPSSSTIVPNPAALRFLWELSEIAGRGGDIRDRLFGSDAATA
jgi:hypothetical protein